METSEMKRIVATILFAVTLAVPAIYAASQEKERSSSQGGQSRETIAIEPRVVPAPPVPPPPPPDYRFDVDIWTDRPAYDIGDLVRINFRVTRACFVYVFDTDTRGVTRQIFPNYFDPDNFVVPGGRYFIPDANYNLRVVGPPGREELRIVAVRYRALLFERRHRFSPQEPFPGYREGSQGFLKEYQREEKRPDSDASRKGGTGAQSREEMRKDETRTRGTAPEESRGSRSAPETSKSRAEVSARHPETIVIEPSVPPPRPPVVIEPRPVYDREWVEDVTAFQVVDPYWQPVPEYGNLDVNSQPSGARVTVDGIVRGYTPLTVRHLGPGFHTVEVSLPGYSTFVEDVEVREGRTAVVNVRLRPDRPRWFFDFHFGL